MRELAIKLFLFCSKLQGAWNFRVSLRWKIASDCDFSCDFFRRKIVPTGSNCGSLIFFSLPFWFSLLFLLCKEFLVFFLCFSPSSPGIFGVRQKEKIHVFLMFFLAFFVFFFFFFQNKMEKGKSGFGWQRGRLRQKIAAICDCDFWCSQVSRRRAEHQRLECHQCQIMGNGWEQPRRCRA